MILFLISVLIVLVVSAFCSLSEAALYAVRRPYVREIAEQGSHSGRLLLQFKDNMERPISAILIINTIANTAGAAVAGAQAQLIMGEGSLIWFSLVFTLAVLFVSEIIPKILGVAYNRPIARALAFPWSIGIALLAPLVWIVERITSIIKPEHTVTAPEEEVNQLAKISAEEGSILTYEAHLIRNVLRIDQVTARDIMTPRAVVMKLSSDMSLKEVSDHVGEFTYSRIPVYEANDPETWIGIAFARDILAGLANDQLDRKLTELCKPAFFVSEKTKGHVLLRSFLNRRTHLFGVADEFGNITGIVTLEDVIESILGEEIVDEVDISVNMQNVAQRRRQEKLRNATDPEDS